MVRVDSPGFLQFITERCERRPALRERVESELKFFAILLVERLGESTARSELGEPGSDRLGPVRSRESREQKKPVSEELEAEVSSSNCHVCRKVEFVYLREILGRGSEESDRSEDEGIETYSASSSDSSMRIWYPHLSMRV
jgi:hypothetical protein